MYKLHNITRFTWRMAEDVTNKHEDNVGLSKQKDLKDAAVSPVYI